MKIIKAIILLNFSLLLLSCNNTANKTSDNQFLITEKGVPGISLGDTMPDKLQNYQLVKSTIDAGEGNQQPVINILENNLEMLQISFRYNAETDNYNNIVSEILVKNIKYKTPEGIAVQSTIYDFVTSYPNYVLWYTYISNMYVIQSKNNKIQFLLDSKGYTGKKDLTQSDMVELTKDDFLTDTKITAIRIYE